MLHGINNIKLNFMVCLQNFYWKKCIDYQYSVQYLEYSGVPRGAGGGVQPPP